MPGSYWSTDPLFARDGNTGEIYFAATDQLGTATALIKASGQIVWKAEKTAFGKTTVTADTSNSGNPVAFNLRFPGQYEDAETGLHYNWHRYYDAGLGRYLSEDPFGLAAGLNVYRYALDNPLRFFDPTGEILPAVAAMYGRCILGCLAGAAAGAAAGAVIDYLMGCDPSLMEGMTAGAIGGAIGGCALECLNPLNWIGGGKGPKPKLFPKPRAKKPTGSYTNTHASGKRYHGKGPPDRMNKSAREKERKYNDPVVDQDYTPAANDREAFKDEARRIANDGGVDNPNNYNQINSPGKKYLEQDGDP